MTQGTTGMKSLQTWHPGLWMRRWRNWDSKPMWSDHRGYSLKPCSLSSLRDLGLLDPGDLSPSRILLQVPLLPQPLELADIFRIASDPYKPRARARAPVKPAETIKTHLIILFSSGSGSQVGVVCGELAFRAATGQSQFSPLALQSVHGLLPCCATKKLTCT